MTLGILKPWQLKWLCRLGVLCCWVRNSRFILIVIVCSTCLLRSHHLTTTAHSPPVLVFFWKTLISSRLDMYQELTMSWLTCSLALGIAPRLMYHQQSILWLLIHHVTLEKEQVLCPYPLWSYYHRGMDPWLFSKNINAVICCQWQSSLLRLHMGLPFE